ncbi:class I SAM-dependent methyltransferase [Haloterrigena salifodinae]|uniref:Class I SAM-dependent methyltransferase n=1 Tax=Haloterrigena salifodinae TaxID=2675099 RepID=A0A8T8E3I8_9EURY|nr:class I SAM-dependent methyltransferase [Haloterrigena salifodinae]QRV16395.1 class I SAM-dependent methyltransferase [Haloterrigena salifodinae]
MASRYNFGVYHWRRRFRSIAAALVAAVLGVAVRRRTNDARVRLTAAGATIGAAVYAVRVLRRLLSPPPWALERAKYDALAVRLPLADADRVLDVGCGTGRSLVGLAPYVSPDADVLGFDVFDDRVILGNGPALARRNGTRASLAVTPVAGDSAALPFADDSIPVVTACRVLHDLEAPAADRTLREIRRVCDPDGALGVLELPLTPDGVSRHPESYWTDRVTAAGFRIGSLERLERDTGNHYLVIVATPRIGSDG